MRKIAMNPGILLIFLNLALGNVGAFSNTIGVTEKEVAELISDAATHLKILFKNELPFEVGGFELNVSLTDIELSVHLRECKLYFVDFDYSSSDILSNDLYLSRTNLVTVHKTKGTIDITGTSKGKEISQTGSFDCIWADFSHNFSATFELEPKSTILTNWTYEKDRGNPKIKIGSIQIEGITKAELEENVIQQFVDQILQEIDLGSRRWTKDMYHYFKKYSFQEIYNRLRKMIPSSHKSNKL